MSKTNLITKLADNKNGFTIIELIVVITIIAVLASIVLVNVSQYLGKGKDSSIQANLSGVVTNGAVFFDTNNNYDGFCDSPTVNAARQAIESSGGTLNCNIDDAKDAWCACSKLLTTSGTVFCIDSTGAKKTVASTDCDTECPVATGACL